MLPLIEKDEQEFSALLARASRACVVVPAAQLPLGATPRQARVGLERDPKDGSILLLIDHGVTYRGPSATIAQWCSTGKLRFQDAGQFHAWLTRHVAPLYRSEQPLPAPRAAVTHPTTSGVPDQLIGHDIVSGQQIRLEGQARRQGLYVVGGTGSGKSTLLENLIAQDLRAGAGLLVLDPHQDLVEEILRLIPPGRADDVIIIDPLDTDFPIGLNLFACADRDDPRAVTRTLGRVLGIFEKLWGPGSPAPSWGPQLAEILRNCTLTLIDNPGTTMAEIPTLLTDAEFRASLVGNVRNRQTHHFWEERYNRLSAREQLQIAQSTLNKVSEFLDQPLVANIIGQSESTIDFRNAMDTGKVILAPLAAGMLGDKTTSLLGSTIVGQTLDAALGRGNVPPAERQPFFVYADEYQRFATPDFATLLAEARKFAVGTVVAHQFRDQFPRYDPNRGATLNVANKIIFTISGVDARELSGEFDATPPAPAITGRQSKLIVSATLLQHVLQTGHESEIVRLFADSILRPMEHASRSQAEVLNFPDARVCYISPHLIRSGLDRINEYFVDVMRGRFPPYSRQAGHHIVGIMEALRGWLGVGRQVTSAFSDRIVPFPAEERGALLRYVEVLALGGLGSKAPVVGRLQKAPRAQAFAQAMPHVGAALAAQPIFVSSGQYEPVYDRPRSYADVRAEIASSLANLQPYHARVKLRRGPHFIEHTVRTLPPPGASISAQQLGENAVRIRRMRTASRQRYARPRAVVEREILLRQSGLGERSQQEMDGTNNLDQRPVVRRRQPWTDITEHNLDS